MPAFEYLDNVEDAVLWRKTGADEYNVSTFSAAEDIKCAWVNKRREITDARGNVVATDVQLGTCETLAVGDVLWRGCVDDIAGTGSDPAPEGGLMTVVVVNDCKDLKGRITGREYSLMRFVDPLLVR